MIYLIENISEYTQHDVYISKYMYVCVCVCVCVCARVH